MSKKFDVAYAQPTKEGQKPRWINCGAIFETEKGFRLKLDVVPVNCNGWFALFEPRARDEQPRQQPKQESSPEFDDDIPF